MVNVSVCGVTRTNQGNAGGQFQNIGSVLAVLQAEPDSPGLDTMHFGGNAPNSDGTGGQCVLQSTVIAPPSISGSNSRFVEAWIK